MKGDVITDICFTRILLLTSVCCSGFSYSHEKLQSLLRCQLQNTLISTRGVIKSSTLTDSVVLCLKVGLAKGLKAQGNVEDWLCKVEEAMFSSLRQLSKAAIVDYQKKSREEWVVAGHPSQVHKYTNTHTRVLKESWVLEPFRLSKEHRCMLSCV